MLSYNKHSPDDILNDWIIPCFVAWCKQSDIFQRVDRLHKFTAHIHDDFIEFEQWPIFFLLKTSKFENRPSHADRKKIENSKIEIVISKLSKLNVSNMYKRTL